ncbi:hypothetical protein BJ165DRAFT_1532585 [Panaeolus papilionaceus]|nr:hypothetical protein BJ165DRAFT_1532585 [Panaeolus papilionaceus]
MIQLNNKHSINRKRNLAESDTIGKYLSRGYRMIRGLQCQSTRKDSKTYFNESRRFVGDSKTWVIPLDKDLLEPLQDPLQINSWELWFNRDERWTSQMSYNLLSSPFLRTSYIAADDVALNLVKYALLEMPAVQDHSSDNDDLLESSSSSSDEYEDTSSDPHGSQSNFSEISDIDQSIATMTAPLHTIPVNISVDLDILTAVKRAFPDCFPSRNVSS